jgi:hypothetical protein
MNGPGDCTIHGHVPPDVFVTVTITEPPDAGSDACVGETEKAHWAAAAPS